MSLNILVVDDSKIMRAIVKKSLQLSDVPVSETFEADSGVSALELLDRQQVDLIFSDINMPEMNGIEFITHLKESEALGKLPVIVISTEGSDERAKEMQLLGVSAFLRKPFSPEEFRDTVLPVMNALSIDPNR